MQINCDQNDATFWVNYQKWCCYSINLWEEATPLYHLCSLRTSRAPGLWQSVKCRNLVLRRQFSLKTHFHLFLFILCVLFHSILFLYFLITKQNSYNSQNWFHDPLMSHGSLNGSLYFNSNGPLKPLFWETLL